jgi:hypothetical protein
METKNNDLLQLPSNEIGYEDRLVIKRDYGKISGDFANTLIHIRGKTFKSERSQLGHDSAHFITANFLKLHPEIKLKLINQFPKIFKSEQDLYWFEPSGEFIPEVFDVIFTFCFSRRDMASLHIDFLNVNSEYWLKHNIYDRQLDMTFIQSGVNGSVELENKMIINENKIKNFLEKEIKNFAGVNSHPSDSLSNMFWDSMLNDINKYGDYMKYAKLYLEYTNSYKDSFPYNGRVFREYLGKIYANIVQSYIEDPLDCKFTSGNFVKPNSIILKNEISRLLSSDIKVDSIYDKFYSNYGGFWDVLQARKYSIQLVLDELKKEGELNERGSQFNFNGNSFFMWACHTRNTAKIVFDGPNNNNFQYMSLL